MYCTRCGKEIPCGLLTCPSCDEIYTEKSRNSSDSLCGYESLGVARALFLITIGSFILNIIISVMDMVDVSALFIERNDSFFGMLGYFSEFGSDDSAILLAILKFGTVLTIICIALMALPILLNKKYKRKYLMLNYPTMIFLAVIYIWLVTVYASPNSNTLIASVNIKATAYIYIIETIFAFISTILFAQKLKTEE